MAWAVDDVFLIAGERNVTWGEMSANCMAFEEAPFAAVVLDEPDPATLLSLLLTAWNRALVPCPVNLRWTQEQRAAASKLVSTLSLGKGRSEGDNPAIVVFTSGSSAEPKAAVLSHGNLRSAAVASNQRVPLCRGDRWLLSLPLYHVGGIGIVTRCREAGATIVVPVPDVDLTESLERYRPTHVSLVATQLYRLLQDDAATNALARCKAVVLGGGPAAESLIRQAIDCGVPLVTSYGMTETAAMICATRPGDPPERLRSSGAPLVEGTVSVSDDGEVRVRGNQRFLGYLREDGGLDTPLDDAGWFHTGDLGHFDEHGYLHVTGRRDNLFISGGENIQPETIESALCDLPGVAEAIAVPVADPEWGQRPVAFVRMHESTAFDAAALLGRVRERLPRYAVPEAIYPWPEDVSARGLKVQRRDFVDRAADIERG